MKSGDCDRFMPKSLLEIYAGDPEIVIYHWLSPSY